MPQPTTRAGWVELLQQKGVEVPRNWTVLEIKARLAEISQEGATSGELDKKLKMLKKATKKKSELVEFLKREEIETNSNQTMAQMYARGLQAITEKFEPSGIEKVGFGKNAELTFLELKAEQPSYLDWCRTTVMESDGVDWRMKRLVEWANREANLGENATLTTKGFKRGMGIPMKHEPGTASDTSGYSMVSMAPKSEAESALQNKEAEIAELKGQLEELRLEMADLHRNQERVKDRKQM